uniref:YqaJ viral recombinase domain-containing protein n=1 Tax=Myripristis murdjan TaxID=586833 RepID=A0A667WH11_9TELE
MAGVGETCTHLLFKVEVTVRCREQKTVTDKPAYWILPSNVNKVLATVGHQINYTSAASSQKSMNRLLDGETDIRPGLRTCARNISTPSPTPLEVTHFHADLHKAGGKSAVLSVLPYYCEEFRDPVQPATKLKSLLSLHDTSMDGCEFSVLEQHCQSLKSQAEVSAKQAEQVEMCTRKQQKCTFWFAARAGRITASNMHAVYAMDIESPALSTVKNVCYPKNTYVATCGFFINPAFPEVGASPDGTVRCSCCGKGCIEIKCPSKYKHSTIHQACLAKDRNFCLELVDGELNLKQGHPYYTQVQTQIFVTDSKYCDFVVWTLKDCAFLHILPNPEFWRAHLQKAQPFFTAVSLPELKGVMKRAITIVINHSSKISDWLPHLSMN